MNTDNLNNESNNEQLPLQKRVDQPEKQDGENKTSEKQKNKKRRNSARAANMVLRSAIGHAKSHRLTDKPGDFAHSGTNISYEN